jgi:hypothetical protein
MRVKLLSFSGLLLLVLLAAAFAHQVRRIERSGAVGAAKDAYLAIHRDVRPQQISLCRFCSSRITEYRGEEKFAFLLSVRRPARSDLVGAEVWLTNGRQPRVAFRSGL